MLVPNTNSINSDLKAGKDSSKKSQKMSKVLSRRETSNIGKAHRLALDEEASSLLDETNSNNNNNNNNDENIANANEIDSISETKIQSDDQQERVEQTRYKFLENNYLLDLLSVAQKTDADLSKYEQYDYYINDVIHLINDDSLIRRFLANPSCSQNVPDCVKAIDEVFKWRKSMQLERLNDESFPVEFYQMMGLFIHGTDKQQLPVMYMRAAAHRKWSPKLDDLFRKFVAYQIDRVTRSTPDSFFTICFDCRGANYQCLDIEFLRYLSKVLVQYYPTSCKYAIVVDLPWIFRSVWKLVRTWLPPECQESVKFVPLKSLHSMIDQENLPKIMLDPASCSENQPQQQDDSSSLAKISNSSKKKQKKRTPLANADPQGQQQVTAEQHNVGHSTSKKWIWTVPSGCRSLVEIGSDIGITQSEMSSFMDHVNRLTRPN